MPQITAFQCEDCSTTLSSSDFLIDGAIKLVGAPTPHGSRGTNRREIIVKEGSYCRTCLLRRLSPDDSRYQGPERGGPNDR